MSAGSGGVAGLRHYSGTIHPTPVPPSLPLFSRAHAHRDRLAIVDSAGRHTYADLLAAASQVAGRLLAGHSDLNEARIAFLTAPDFSYAAIQWGIWLAGGIAVPLATSHPSAELEYVIRDSGAETVMKSLPPPLPTLPASPSLSASRRAMMVYTSGSTGKPKGVVTTHANLEAQVSGLIEAWEWSRNDRILLVLPLHHVHGIVTVLTCALWAGATCEMAPTFDAVAAWERLASGEITLFMAVPTIYRRLIAAWEAKPTETRQRWSRGVARLRLMVSGSAALPVQTLERWREISGHTLLERYGMTEIGMALSNPLHGERRPGCVGVPLPGVQVRLVDERGPTADGPGEIEVKGANVFLEYWNRPDSTREAFRDGWFRTGDIALVENGSYRILGRASVDIIKTGGYKVSALEIEEVLRTHPAIAECAVVGIADAEWGERVAVAVELRPGASLELEALKEWARERLAPYKVPRSLRAVPALPKNAMGKVVKPEVALLFTGR
jgi:malonyl-CoA/methylmalonyl-CoA synthetase